MSEAISAPGNEASGGNRAFWSIAAVIVLCFLLIYLALRDMGPRNFLNTVPVSVMVMMDDEPIDGVQVMFFPVDAEPWQRPAAGTTDTAGRCMITTARFDDGATPGYYLVGIAKSPKRFMRMANPAFALQNVGTGRMGTDSAPGGRMAGGMLGPGGMPGPGDGGGDPTRMYRSAMSGGQLPEYESELPARYMQLDASGLSAQVIEDGDNDFVFTLSR